RMSGRWGIDAASSWTARGLGYSPDEQNMPWATYPATEIFAAIGLQRCQPLRIEEMKGRWFCYHIWTYPLEISVLPAAVVMGKGQIAEKYVFEAKMRSKQYGSFDWGRPWTEEKAEEEAEEVRGEKTRVPCLRSSLHRRKGTLRMTKPKSVNELADELLDIKGPAAIVGEEWLRPVEGHGSVIFPPSYAGARPGEGTYNIDDTPNGKTA